MRMNLKITGSVTPKAGMVGVGEESKDAAGLPSYA